MKPIIFVQITQLSLSSVFIVVQTIQMQQKTSTIQQITKMKVHQSKILLIFSIFTLALSQLVVNNCQTQVRAVSLGFPISYSSYYANDCNLPILDFANYCWAPLSPSTLSWVQVSSSVPVFWVAVITQGRSSYDQWIKQYQVSYSVDGQTWTYVDNGRIFAGNSDRNTKVRNSFYTAVLARTLRIHPVSWYGWSSLRFDAIFVKI